MKKLIALIITLCMVFGPCALFASAETPVVYLSPDAHLHITSTGYYYDGQDETAFVGDYFLYGYGYRLYIESEGTYNVTLHNYTAELGGGGEAVRFNAAATLNLTIKGINLLKSNAKHVINTNGIEGCTVTLDIAENSGITFDNYYWNDRLFAVDPLITFTMADGSAVAGTDVEGWNTAAFTVENGTPTAHSIDYFYADDQTCAYGCEICELALNSQEHHYGSYVEAEGGHRLACTNCYHPIGEVEPHKMTEWYSDSEYCINYCYDCYYEADAVPHDITETKVEGNGIEAAHILSVCENCGLESKEYDPETAIIIEMYDDYADSWNGALMILYIDGKPTKIITMSASGYYEYFGIEYDEDTSVALQWISGGSYPNEIGLAVYNPESEDAVFDQFDMTDFGVDMIYSANVADYTEIDGLMEEIPDFLEDYTADSVSALVDALKTVEYMLPASKQESVDAMADALNEAIDGLTPAGEGDTPSRGVINHSNENSVWVYTDFYEYSDGDSYDYDESFVVFGKGDTGIFFDEGVEAKVELINLEISSTDGCIGMYGSSVEMSFFGRNLLVADSEYEGYAGIDMDNASLHILDSKGALVAIGADNCAGIGGYEWYDEETGEPIAVNAGDITIDGGNIYAFSTGDGAGIGGGYGGGFDTITINGGNIHAECLDDDGAGIGAGDDGFGGSIIINGGNITALSLDDDGAGIGGADSGYVEEITINGGTIVVGSDDAAGIGGGEESVSFGGKITINGGIIMAHEGHDNDKNLIGNGNGGSKEADEDNFVIINGGIIVTNNSTGIYPLPTDSEGNPIDEYNVRVNESLRDSSVTLALSDDSTLDVTAYGVDVNIYLVNDVTVTNAKVLACDVNGDQAADMFDYLVVKRVYFEVFDYTNFDYACADVDGDGEVTPFDYLNVKKAYFNS